MNALSWIQFAVGTFSALLQEIVALKHAGVATAISTPAVVAQANSAPGVTTAHQAVISAAGTAAQTVADALPASGPVTA